MDSKVLATQVRKDVLRMTYKAKSSHVGCALSIVDILAVLYTNILDIDYKKKNVKDKFILSKGHAGAALYSILENIGFFPKKLLDSYCADGSELSGHISHKGLPGIEISTGSLGHGGSIACGMAVSLKRRNSINNVYVLLGDGECNEGSVWEMALFASHHKLDNLIIIIDHNKLQGLGKCDEIMNLGNLSLKWKSFGWTVYEVDGHDHEALKNVFLKKEVGSPKCIIAHTIKGKGVSFMENRLSWHYKSPSEEELIKAMDELRGNEI